MQRTNSAQSCEVSILSPPFQRSYTKQRPIVLVGPPREVNSILGTVPLVILSTARIIVDARLLYYPGLGLCIVLCQNTKWTYHCWQRPDRQLQYDLFCHPDCKPVYSIQYTLVTVADGLRQMLILSVVSSASLGVEL
jgi:hypothetical protein